MKTIQKLAATIFCEGCHSQQMRIEGNLAAKYLHQQGLPDRNAEQFPLIMAD